MKKYRGWILGIVIIAALAFYVIWAKIYSPTPATVTDSDTDANSISSASTSATTTPSISYIPPSNLGVGSTGTAVVALQQVLINKGYLTIVSAPTGYFGPYTKAALAEYQADNGSTGTGTGQYTDGTYTGSLADAIYGKLQVTVTISNGMITNVTFPVYPNSPGHTSQVSASALPQLEQEAIASQSANVNIVSGATQDSQAFQQSLAAALAQAKG
jgi:uncharacterized protein with FMN-binding domain